MRMADCHKDKKHHSKGLCQSCYFSRANKIRLDNPEFRQKQRDRSKQWRKDNPERAYLTDFKKHLIRNYGITYIQYESMLKNQNNVCKICKNPESLKLRKRINKLAVDHCHKTGKIRGLLCFKCNVSLARIEFAGIKSFLDYLNEEV